MNTNSKFSWRALSGAARMAGLCALLLGTGCTNSTPSNTTPEPARQSLAPAAVHTSRHAAIQTDLSATETVNGSVHAYQATLPPAAVVGTISQSIEASWNANFHAMSQAPTYPQGWTLDYYSGSTKLSAEPATAAQWAQVTRIVTTGSLKVEAVDGDRQALISTVSAPPATVASSFSGGSAGDGWNVFFDPAYTQVFNIHHHNGPATVMCRKLSDSSTCPGFPITLTQTSNRSTGHIDAQSNKLWQPTVGSGPKLAWDCVDLDTRARCATPVVLSQHTAVSTNYDAHIDPVVIGRKMYAVGFVSGGTRISCLDMASGTECPGTALPQNGAASFAGLAAAGSRLFVITSAGANLDCYESTTWARCAGSWPKATTGSGSPVWTPRSADGVIRNVCANNQCFSLDGSAHTLPTGFAAYLTANPVVGVSYTAYQYGSAHSLGTRSAWSITGNKVACWDAATDARCSPGFPISVPVIYAPVLDPEDPDCLWTNSDDGVIRNWKISTATAGCGGGPPRISFKAAVSIPRLSCNPESRVYQYKSFKLIAPAPSLYTSARLTIRDSNSVPIPGWTNVTLPADATVDLTTLDPAVAGSTPTFDIAATGLTDTTVTPVGEFRVTTGSPPQLCWELSVPPLTCPTRPGLAGNDQPGPRQTSVTARGSYSTTANTTPFTDQVLAATVDANPPNFDNCNGTRLRTTVVSLTDGSPVPGATVYLLDSAGNPVLDANNQPVSAVSAADGSVEFPVWAAGYSIKLSGTPRYTPVFSTVNSGGSGTTFASAGSVVSNTVTTSPSQTSQVTLTVTVDHEAPCAPVITSPPGGTVTYGRTTPLTGTADAGNTVVVKINGQPVCTTVADDLGQWHCNADLPPGPSTVTATQTDPAGNSSETSSAVLITRRDGIDKPVITGPSSQVRGQGVTVTGTAQPNADVTVKDEAGNTVCTAKADDDGAWECDTRLSAGPHTLTADSQWQGFENGSAPHDTTVLDDAWFQGSGCASTGGAQPALMMVMALAGLLMLRRRA